MSLREPIRTILFATTGMHVGGGIANVSRCISRSLEEEVVGGRLDRVDVLSLLDSPDAPIRCSGEVRFAQASQLRFIWQARRLLQRRPDMVVLDHLGLGRAFRLPMVSRPKPRRTAVFIHGTEFWALNGGPRERVVSEADVVLTNSEFTASTVRARLPGLDSRLHPVLLCIDPALIDRWLAFRPEDRPSREPAVLIVARMHRGEPGKGHAALLDAWPRVRSFSPNARLWVVGDGTARADLELRASELGTCGVEFLGRISDDELSSLYRRASAFAMPSQQEGFGLVYAEAMWHGLPCIGSSADAAKEVIRSGETGIIVPYGDSTALADALIRLLVDSDLRESMGARARIEAESRFGFPRFRGQLLSALGIEPHG